MPRFFFHVHDGTLSPDTEGIELPDIDSAWSEAVSTCGEMLRDLDGKLPPDTTWQMQVAGEDGQPLFTLQFSSRQMQG